MSNSRGIWLITLVMFFILAGSLFAFNIKDLIPAFQPIAESHPTQLSDEIPIDLRPTLDGQTASYLGRYPGKETEEVKRLADEINDAVTKIPRKTHR